MEKIKEKRHSILSKLLKYSHIIILIILMIPILFVSAEGGTGDGGGTSTNVTVKIENPLDSGIETLPDFIEAVIKIVLIVGIPIVALAIIYTGFLFVSAQGNPEKLTKAKKALVYTLIGAVLLLGAFVIANAISETVDEIKSTA